MRAEQTTEFDYLLKLEQARTPGEITAEGNKIKLGTYYTDFKRSSDAQYLARAATTVPRLIKQLVLARSAIQKYLGDLEVVRKENSRLRRELDEAEKKLAQQDRIGQARRADDYDYRIIPALMTGPDHWIDMRNKQQYQTVGLYFDSAGVGDD